MQRYVFIWAKKVFLVLGCAAGLFCLGACGPKTVGDDVAVALPSGAVSAAHDPSQARYPMGGNYTNARSVEAVLYHVNTSVYMQARQQKLDTFLQQNAAKHAPNDYTNLQPRQVSPFRE